MQGGDSGQPVVLHDPESPAARALRDAARALAGQI
jgi:MinD-like ATPase involved in chromosome partitioning or flagellar assembly